MWQSALTRSSRSSSPPNAWWVILHPFGPRRLPPAACRLPPAACLPVAHAWHSVKPTSCWPSAQWTCRWSDAMHPYLPCLHACRL